VLLLCFPEYGDRHKAQLPYSRILGQPAVYSFLPVMLTQLALGSSCRHCGCDGSSDGAAAP
jgi:hypothetical protein